MKMRNIFAVLACVFLVFGTQFISFSPSNANVRPSNSVMASNTIYVDASNANDPLQNGSSSHPFSTIQKGIDNASAGDTVFVRNGHYYETVSINQTLNLVGESSGNTIIDGQNTMASGKVVDIQEGVINVNISGFTIENAKVRPFTGIYAESENNQTNIFGNNIILNDQAIVVIQSSNVTITNNEISNNTDGVNLLSEDLYANVSDNTISASGYTSSQAMNIGIGCNYTEVFDNSIKNVTIGMTVQGGWEDIIGNYWNYVTLGLQLNGTYDSTFESNMISSQQQACGIELVGPNGEQLTCNNVFSDNTVDSFYYGLYAYLSDQTISTDISNNTLVGNTFIECYYGVIMENTSSNYIYHNNFLENNIQAANDGGSNFWNKGYPCGGNYWSDYSGNDTHWGENQNKPGSDLIGDTPYVNGNVKDAYPLMEPYPIPDVWYLEDSSIAAITLSKITSFEFDNNTGISLNLTSGANSVCILIIPKSLLDGAFNLLIDNIPSASIIAWSIAFHMITFVTGTGSHNVQITAEYVNEPLAQLADINHDGKVDLADLVDLAKVYGQTVPDP
jgi:parallel beta-helix repeat protein